METESHQNMYYHEYKYHLPHYHIIYRVTSPVQQLLGTPHHILVHPYMLAVWPPH